MRSQASLTFPRRLSTTKVTTMSPLCVEQALETRTVQCVNTGHILKRMKGLKKLKRKMGIAPRVAETNVVEPSSPLEFHTCYGANLRLTHGGRGIRRMQSFCKGICFSNRPVKINEKVYIRLQEISTNWSGVLRFGFSAVNPELLRGALPKYACPDLTGRHDCWAKALSERHGKQGSILHFSFNNAGEMVYGIDQVDIGVFLKGIKPSETGLYAVFDVYGNSTALQFVDQRTFLNNRANAEEPNLLVRKTNHALSNRNTPAQPARPYRSSNAPEGTVTIPGFGNLSITDPTVIRAIDHATSRDALPLRVHQNVFFNPMSFHCIKGENVSFTDHNRTVAKRKINEYSKGYAFTGRPLAVNEKIVVQVLAVEPHYVGAMAFGVTSANPSALRPFDLPEDCDELLDRSEYWVVCKDVAASPKAGDELSFTYSASGQITFAKNNGSPHVIMHVDSSLQLYAFFDLFGHTSKLRILGTVKVPDPNRSMEQQHRDLQRRLQATAGGSTRLSLQQRTPPTSATSSPPLSLTSSPNSSSYSPLGGSSSQNNGSSSSEASECSVCYEKQIDSVLYSCGHMCMCYPCAIQQWKGRGGGMCPICRAVIKDVIRTYKS